jgi:hypothetical protein
MSLKKSSKVSSKAKTIKYDDYHLSLVGKKQGRVKKERRQSHEIDLELRTNYLYH